VGSNFVTLSAECTCTLSVIRSANCSVILAYITLNVASAMFEIKFAGLFYVGSSFSVTTFCCFLMSARLSY
jgi:hypothetical protein